MAISVKNSASNTVEVSINNWETDVDTSTKPFKMAPGASDSWKRTDLRGYVIYVQLGGSATPYYVMSTSNIVIYDDKVTDSGQTLLPANKRFG
ncbi:hypothetical protein GSH05_00890 [Burkholderia pseudomallei]|uniref:hypothetical protein n=1 Tax=Burkholderia pseudomallei TaxID=28450 RepID=UPI00050E2937|nr:hypothetical protein [Burkholderia pseudomallei]AIS89394.1 hypothetical protein BBU_2968 [Burkholderia pseudomallei NAU35A-3]AIV85917.1 hypothetical protein X978_1466 [Burkholderia pseudomallei MSHR3965]AJX75976.1 hypothetical protein BG16_1459 [Burkholderia pseudomallei MSHR2543]APY99631.1 hypothetical protein BGI49_11870 [Burkholderia pseudomallei]APZ13225.1 hypothetical protein BGI52_12040 [Burkholderia pseudomallei]